jgi:hypothetical protein
MATSESSFFLPFFSIYSLRVHRCNEVELLTVIGVDWSVWVMQLSGLPNKTAIMDCTTPENIHDLIQISDDLLKNQAVMRNSNGEKVTLEETHEERLSWFADQMIIQKKLREQKPSDTQRGSQHTLPPYIKEGLGPTSRLVSPLFAHLFEQRKHADLPGLADKARSLRF